MVSTLLFSVPRQHVSPLLLGIGQVWLPVPRYGHLFAGSVNEHELERSSSIDLLRVVAPLNIH